MWFVPLEMFYRYGFGREMVEESGADLDMRWRSGRFGVVWRLGV